MTGSCSGDGDDDDGDGDYDDIVAVVTELKEEMWTVVWWGNNNAWLVD